MRPPRSSPSVPWPIGPVASPSPASLAGLDLPDMADHRRAHVLDVLDELVHAAQVVEELRPAAKTGFSLDSSSKRSMSIFVMREIEVMGMTWIIVPNSGDSDRMWSACKPWQRKARRWRGR